MSHYDKLYQKPIFHQFDAKNDAGFSVMWSTTETEGEENTIHVHSAIGVRLECATLGFILKKKGLTIDMAESCKQICFKKKNLFEMLKSDCILFASQTNHTLLDHLVP